MTPEIDIRPQDLAMVQAIVRTHLPSDARVMVFGSRAKPPARRGADLDLAVDLGRALTSEESFQLAEAFDESDLPYKVDVLDLTTAQEPFKSIITPDLKPLPRLPHA